MRAGTLRQRITIQQMTPGNDGQGGTTRTPSTLVSSLPAAVEPLSGQEAMQVGAQTSELRTKVTIRYRDDVTATQRIVWGDRTLQIGSIQDPDGRRRSLELFCAEVQA
jgi:SPP1 family predicted phage head-tail adaptor